jgi:hypothetical protein
MIKHKTRFVADVQQLSSSSCVSRRRECMCRGLVPAFVCGAVSCMPLPHFAAVVAVCDGVMIDAVVKLRPHSTAAAIENNSILRGVHSAPRAAHAGAPTLRRLAATSALFLSIAISRGVTPDLQHSE